MGKKGILKSCPPTGKADRGKLAKAILPDGLPDVLHEPAVEGYVMERK
jgi:hypothetical protein